MVWFLRRWKIRKKRVLRRSKKHFLIAFLQNVRRSFKISSTSRFRSLCLFIVCRNSSGAGAYCKKRDRRAGHSSDHGLEHRKEEGLMPGTPLGTPLESSKPDTFRDFQRHRRTQEDTGTCSHSCWDEPWQNNLARAKVNGKASETFWPTPDSFEWTCWSCSGLAIGKPATSSVELIWLVWHWPKWSLQRSEATNYLEHELLEEVLCTATAAAPTTHGWILFQGEPMVTYYDLLNLIANLIDICRKNVGIDIGPLITDDPMKILWGGGQQAGRSNVPREMSWADGKHWAYVNLWQRLWQWTLRRLFRSQSQIKRGGWTTESDQVHPSYPVFVCFCYLHVDHSFRCPKWYLTISYRAREVKRARLTIRQPSNRTWVLLSLSDLFLQVSCPVLQGHVPLGCQFGEASVQGILHLESLWRGPPESNHQWVET